MKKILNIFLAVIFTFIGMIKDSDARTPVEITKSGVIRIGICDDLPPVQFKDANGGFSGIDPDLGRMIAEALGVKPEWKIISSPKYRADMLINRKADLVISSLSITKERLEAINLSDPYYTTGLSIMIRKSDRGIIKSYDDLAGKTIVTIKGSTGEKLLFDLGLDARVIPLADTPSTFEYLSKGQADAVINDRVFLDHYASDIKDVCVLDGTLSANQYGVGMNLQDTELLDFVNTFLKNVRKDGNLNSLIARYVKGIKDVEVAKEKISDYKIYEVQESDTLIGIARKFYNDPTKWNLIYSNNTDTIKIASILNPGWKIKIPELKNDEKVTTSSVENVRVISNKQVNTVMNNTANPAQAGKKKKNSSKIQEYDLNEIEKYDKTFN